MLNPNTPELFSVLTTIRMRPQTRVKLLLSVSRHYIIVFDRMQIFVSNDDLGYLLNMAKFNFLNKGLVYTTVCYNLSFSISIFASFDNVNPFFSH